MLDPFNRWLWLLVFVAALGCGGGDRYDKYSSLPSDESNSDKIAEEKSPTATQKVANQTASPEPEEVMAASSAKPAGSTRLGGDGTVGDAESPRDADVGARPTPTHSANSVGEDSTSTPTNEAIAQATKEATGPAESGTPDSPTSPTSPTDAPHAPPHHEPLPTKFVATFNEKTTVSVAGREMLVSDRHFPVSIDSVYKLSLVALADGPGAATAAHYFGIICCDQQRRPIGTYHVAKYPGAVDTTLATELRPGDRRVSLTTAKGWSNAGPEHQRSLAWYLGDSQPPSRLAGGYTRTYSIGAWAENGIVNNVLSLRQPWQGPHLPAGTVVRNAMSGPTYNYAMLAGEPVPSTPSRYVGAIRGEWKDGEYSAAKFRPGTAFIQALVLADWKREAGTPKSTLTIRDFTIERMEP